MMTKTSGQAARVRRSGAWTGMALASLLVGCGGGDGGGGAGGVAVVTSPTPTPAASPSPTPSPTATVATLVPPLGSFTLPATSARLFLTYPRGLAQVTKADASLGEAGTGTVAYDASTAAYTLSGSGGGTGATALGNAFTRTFPSSARANGNGVTQPYVVTEGAVRDIGEFYINGPTGTYLPLNYVTSAAFIRTDSSDATTNTLEYRGMMAGLKSPSLPTSGTVTYQARADGFLVDGSRLFRILGSETFNVTIDFAQETVRVPINFTVNSDLEGRGRGTQAFYAIGAIICHVRRNTTGAARIHSDDHQEYLFSGDFYGPSQDEVGITFMIRTQPNTPIIAVTIMGKKI